MGLADFLAEAGGNTVVGHVARASGGRTSGQRSLDAFINEELPAMAEAFERETNPANMGKLGMQFIQAGARAGLPVAGIEKLLDMLTGPAKKNLATKGYEQMAGELAPKVEGRPEGVEGPAMESGAFLERPGKPFDTSMAARAAAIQTSTGVPIPNEFNALLQVPSKTQHEEAQATNQQASQRQTQQKIEEEERVQAEIGRLSDVVPEGSSVSPRGLARINRNSISQLTPQREMSGGTRELKQQQLLATIERGTAAAATAAERADAAAAKAELDRQRFAFDQEKHRAGMITDVAPGPVPVMERTGTINQVAKEVGKAVAGLPPAEQSEALKKAFHAAGYEVEGDLSLAPEGGFLGFGTTDKIRGITDFRPRSRVINRRPGGTAPTGAPTPAGQGRYSQGVPSGSAPAPAQGGGAPAAPKAGTVVRGYRFRGGDPADQANWEKVR